MKQKEIENYRRNLVEIQKNDDLSTRTKRLKDLAKTVGASTNMREGSKLIKYATEPQLIENINDALRSESMIGMCRTANRNFFIALIATIIGLVSALAAWVAVCK